MKTCLGWRKQIQSYVFELCREKFGYEGPATQQETNKAVHNGTHTLLSSEKY